MGRRLGRRPVEVMATPPTSSTAAAQRSAL
ncbi:MAG: hypothetical protein QOI83_721, partial [Streptomycetaceae bacterium]|nr:hypothetical protein [Streptomycetaceae bacterium]